MYILIYIYVYTYRNIYLSTVSTSNTVHSMIFTYMQETIYKFRQKIYE